MYTGDGPAQDVLTTGSSRVSNSLTGGISRHLDATSSISAGGSYGLLHFFGGYGLDNTQTSADVSRASNWRESDTGSISATYGIFSYPGSYSFTSKGLSLGFSRQLTRSLTADGSAGPLWVNSSDSLAIPPRLDVSVDAGVTYSRNRTTVSVHATRGVNGGSGVQPGALATGVQGVVNHDFSRSWALSFSETYFHTSGLSQLDPAITSNPVLASYFTTGAISSEYSAVQVSRRFTDNLSGFASYTAQDQFLPNTPVANSTALSGLSNVFGIGVSFSPRSTRLGQF